MAQLNLVVFYRHSRSRIYFYVPNLDFPIRISGGRGKGDPREAIKAWLEGSEFFKKAELPGGSSNEILSIKRIPVKRDTAWLCEVSLANIVFDQSAAKRKWKTAPDVVHSPDYSDLLSIFIQIAHDRVVFKSKNWDWS